MKKSTIVSIVLALMLAANAAAAATPAIAKKAAVTALKRDKLFRRNHNNDKKKKRDGSCSVITCIDEGDTCDINNDTMVCMNDFYCINSKCVPPKSEGESCSGYSECGEDLMCNITRDDKIPSVCIPYPEKAGDPCSVYNDNCPARTKCVYGVCTTYPTTVGADCVEEVGCGYNQLYCNSEHKCAEYPKDGEDCLNGDCAYYHYCNSEQKCVSYRGEGEDCINYYYHCDSGLYCDRENDKCVKYPGEGETCYNDYYCDSDLYCDLDDKKCVKYPALGEECIYRYGCASGLVCDRDQDRDKYVCYNKTSGEGGYCSYDVNCEDGLFCNYNKNKCISGECKYDDECHSGKGCNNFKCIEYMSLNDGEECRSDGTNSFFCKEGSGCGRNESSSTGYSCMKITTKISDEIECEDDDDCPSDSYCECNSLNGKMQCIPSFVSNKTMVGYYKKYLTMASTGEYLESIEEFNACLYFLSQYINPVNEYGICYTINYTLLPEIEPFEGVASNMKPSFALSAVLFVFCLIAAML